MARKADIRGDLNLDSSGFDRTLQRADKSVKGFVSSSIKQFGALAGAAGFGMLARKAASYVARIEDMARMSGTSVEEFQRLTFAARTLGIEQDKVGDILKDVSDKVGDFLQTGAGPMADFFENIAPKVGVTADMFRDLSGKEALQLYVDSLEKANLSQNEMTFYMEAIASDATLLLPLLSDNAAELDRLAGAAERMGLILREDMIKEFKESNNSLEVLSTITTIYAAKLLTKLVPAVQILGNGLGFLGEMYGVAILNGKAFFDLLVSNTMTVIGPTIKQFKALGVAIEAALNVKNPAKAAELFKESLEMSKEATKSLLSIPGQLKENFEEFASDVKFNVGSLGDDLESRAEAIGRSWSAMFGDIESDSKKATEAAKKATAESTKSSKASKSQVQVKKELSEKILQIELAIIRAQARGKTGAVAALEKRLKLANRIVEIMAKGASQEEATRIANAELGKKSSMAKSSGPRGIQTGKITTGKIGENFQKRFGPGGEFGMTPTMEQRERAAGLFLAGNDPLRGRRPSGIVAQDKSGEGRGTQERILDVQKEILSEIRKNP